MKKYNSPKSVYTIKISTPRTFSEYISLIWREAFDTDMQAYIVVVDNVKVPKNLSQFAHNMLWPSNNVGFCSLLTSVYDYNERHGFNLRNKGLLLKHYEALIYPKAAIFSLISESELPSGFYKSSNIAGVLGYWAKFRSKDVYHFSPSLCQNDWDDGHMFVGEDYDVSWGVGQWRSATG